MSTLPRLNAHLTNLMFGQFFSYKQSDPFPDVAEAEPPDPNLGRDLSDSFRTARRILVAVCGVCLAWSTAQFSVEELSIDAVGLSVDLKSASIPLLLGVSLIYLTCRWTLEFAMMPRNVRRWPLAKLDFQLVSFLVRFSVLAVTAGALNRSLRSIGLVVISLCCLVVLSIVLTVVLTFITAPIRMWARERANRVSAANAVGEGLFWAGLFAVVLTIVLTILFSIASYSYEALRMMLWPIPPNPLAFSIFVFTLLTVFVSHWLIRPVTGKLFAERPDYWTQRMPTGEKRVTIIHAEKEPLL